MVSSSESFTITAGSGRSSASERLLESSRMARAVLTPVLATLLDTWTNGIVRCELRSVLSDLLIRK